MDPPPARRKIVGSIQRTTSASSPTPSSSASSTPARPTRPPLATQSSPVSSTYIARSRTATNLSGTTIKARVKVTSGASFADGSGPALAPPASPSAGCSWSDAGSDVGSAVGSGAGPSLTGRRAPSPVSTFGNGPARLVVTGSPRVVGSAVSSSARPGQVHARSSPIAPTAGSKQGSAGPPKHVRSNSAGLNALSPSISSPASRSGTPNLPSSALSASISSRPLTASVRAAPSTVRGLPSASAPSTPFYQAQSQAFLGTSSSRSPPPPAERGSGAESPPQYFSQQRSASIPQDRYLSYSPPPTLAPLPAQPAEPVPSSGPVAGGLPASTPDRRSVGSLEARRSSTSSSFSSSDSPDSRFSPSAGSALSQPVSTSSFSSVSYDPPPVSPGFLNGLPSIPSASCLDVTSRSPQETIKLSLANRVDGFDVEIPPEEDPLSKQEEKDAKVNRKIADLEISNASLLAVNHSLEAAKAKQAREIRDLRRRFRSGTNLPPPLRRSSSSRHSFGRSRSSSHSSQSLSSDETSDGDDDEAEEDDPQFARMKEVMLSMLEKGMSALAVKVPEPSGWGRSVGGGGGRVLGILEMGEWREKEGAEGEDDEAESGTPSPRPETAVEPATDEMMEA